MNTRPLRLEPGWKAALADEFAQPYMAELRRYLVGEMHAGKTVLPPPSLWFHALDLTPRDQVRVVILGQDPYHGAGQAHGLCFSVRNGIAVPPSLINIKKEIRSDLGIEPGAGGDLSGWARQGVLLLNSVLTVEQGRPAAHQGHGWERFTDAVISAVNARPRPVVFLLWGTHARKKAANVDSGRHLLLTCAHPSPLSAHSGFLGCRHFSQTNAFLESHGEPPIDWRIGNQQIAPP